MADETTKLSTKGQVIIPKPVRTAHNWKSGQEFDVVDTGDGVLLRPRPPFAATDINDVAGCLEYSGTAKSLEEMHAAAKKGIRERGNGRS